MLNKLFVSYYNYANVFDKSQTNTLSLYRFYDHKLKFAEKIHKNTLFKSRIYSILDYKFEHIKKHLNEHLKKEFIILNYVSFALFVLFIEKSNENCDFM